MQDTAQEFATATINAAAGELDSAVKKLKHCLNQLTDEQLWWRPSPSMNSIANLLLHIRGNLRQWIVSGVGGVPDTRNRPLEFSERGPIPTQELLQRLESTVAEVKAVLVQSSPADLVNERPIQGFHVTGIAAVFHSVAHFQGHVQEIVNLTRTQLGDHYEFAFVPTTPEEGAA